jgi:hypothetical protein
VAGTKMPRLASGVRGARSTLDGHFPGPYVGYEKHLPPFRETFLR